MFPDVAPKPGEALCRLEEIDDGGTWSKMWGEARNVFPLVMARRGDAVFAYVNVCPHQFLPLDNYIGEFLTDDGERFFCMHHGATFAVTDGLCLSGPCRGAHLLKVNVEVVAGVVTMGRWPDPPPRPAAAARDRRP